MNVATTNNTNRRPWYLKKGWVYAMCLITPPIGLINVLLNQNRWQNNEKGVYLLIAIVMGIIWVTKFFPFWVSIITLVLAFLIIYIWPEEP